MDRFFKELADEYEPWAKARKASTTTHRERSKMKLLLKVFGDCQLTEITVRVVERYMETRLQKVKPRTVNLELALLRHMLNKAVDWGYLSVNSVMRVKPFKEPPGRTRYLTNDECRRLLDACRHSKSRMLYSIVLTALLTGMRKGELQRLTWEDVDFERKIITVRQAKNNETRCIPINPTLLSILLGLHRSYPHAIYVFSKPDGTAYGDWKRSFRTACEQAELKDFRFHDLRHTFASQLAIAGVEFYTLQELLGHKTPKMTMRYIHLPWSQLQEAVNKLQPVEI